jgi:putative spermidine/putrescine transport system ATP-binding protein
VHVTHDQQEALAIADRLAVMRAGRIVQVGDGEPVPPPGHPFVATFLGRVNRLRRDADARRRHVLKLGELELPCPPQWGRSPSCCAPEDIELCAPQLPGVARAEVLQRRFLGERVQLSLALAHQEPLSVELGATTRPAPAIPWACAWRHNACCPPKP